MFASRSVKRFAVGRRRNFRGQLMSHADVERADAAASFAVGILTVAAAVKNGDVGDDDFHKIII